MSTSFYIPSQLLLTLFMSRQVPGLPQATAGSKRRPKKNKSGIDGRIMDPIARRAAQRAAKAAAAQHSAPSSRGAIEMDVAQSALAAVDIITQTVHILFSFYFGSILSEPCRSSMMTMKTVITLKHLVYQESDSHLPHHHHRLQRRNRRP
jgi:hypothetical protein